MEKFKIEIVYKKETILFEVADYLHHSEDYCKFEVFKAGKFIAAFEPDNHRHLHLCKNTGTVDETILNLVADKLESLEPYLRINLPGRF